MVLTEAIDRNPCLDDKVIGVGFKRGQRRFLIASVSFSERFEGCRDSAFPSLFQALSIRVFSDGFKQQSHPLLGFLPVVVSLSRYGRAVIVWGRLCFVTHCQVPAASFHRSTCSRGV